MTPGHEKAPLIRILGRVIYFDSSKEGAKLREAFPHSPAEISSRAAPPPWRERGILKPDVRPGLWKEAGLRPSAQETTARLSSLLLHTFPALPRHPTMANSLFTTGGEKERRAHCDQLWRGHREPGGVWNWRVTYSSFSTL